MLVNISMKFFISLFSLVVFSFSCLADYTPMPSPAVCDNTTPALKTLMDDGYKPLIYSEARPDKNKSTRINLMVWGNVNDEILVTVTRLGGTLTCIVALGDENTTWVGAKKDEKN